MKQALSLTAACLVVIAMASPAAAVERPWHLRVFAAGFDGDLSETLPAENPDEVQVSSDSDLGFGGSIEYQFSNLIGVELGAFTASPDIVLSADVPGFGEIALSDGMSTTALTLDANFHLTPSSDFFDVYVGAGLVNLGYGDLHWVDPEGDPLDVSVSSDFTYSAKAGVGIAFGAGSRWAAFGGLRYIWSDLEFSQPDVPDSGTASVDFNIFSFTVGVAISF
jgi:outer membrane protein W